MLQPYKGSYYKGNNVGYRQFRQKGGKTLSRITNNIQSNFNSKSNSKTFWIVFGVVGLIILIGFFYFNRKENQFKTRDNVSDTIELIQGIAKYNLETDLAKSQSANSTKRASINNRNPAQVKEIQLEKQKAIAIETKRRNDYMAQQYALDYTQNDITPDTSTKYMKQSHDQFYQPPQPVDSTQYSDIIPIDKSRQEQTRIMYDAQFNNLNNNNDTNRNEHIYKLNNLYQEKPYYKINSPFIHPEESIRPLQIQPKEFNNTLEVGDKPDMFLQNIPNNVFNNSYFQVNNSYESPFLSTASGVSKYGNPIRSANQPINKCLQNSNINQSNDSQVENYSHPDYYYNVL